MRRPPLPMLVLAGVMAMTCAPHANADTDLRYCYEFRVATIGIPPVATLCTLLTP